MEDIKILVVEDNELNSQLICESLTTMGYENNHRVKNYDSAIEFVENNKTDLILMDIMLKGSKDGVTIAKKIQTEHDIPIIYITGYAKDKIIKRVKDTNPYAFITKPFKFEELKANVEIALTRHKSNQKKNIERLKYEQAFVNMHCGVITTDDSGVVLFINKVAEILTGFKSDEATKLRFDQVFSITNENYTSKKLLNETIRKGTVHKFKENLKIRSKKGSEISVEIKTSFVTELSSNFITIFFWEKPEIKKHQLLKSNFDVDLQEYPINIIAIGNDSMLRQGILNVLDADKSIKIRCQVSSKLEILECSYSNDIDLAIIFDDSNYSDELFDIIKFLKNEVSDVKILVINPKPDDKNELRLIENTVSGVVSYKEDNVNIPLTIHSIMNGDLWYRRDILNNYVKQKNTNINIKITANDKTFDMFSLKEKQIIAFASQGYTNKDIGDKLSIAEGTVKNYLYRIYKKLNIHNKKDLKAYSLKYFD